MKLCLIGSSRFKHLYDEWNRKLTLSGHVVYSIATVSTSIGSQELKVSDKETLDLVHLIKIRESEGVVLITDESGYFGESTRRELKWARLHRLYLYGIGEDLSNLPVDYLASHLIDSFGDLAYESPS